MYDCENSYYDLYDQFPIVYDKMTKGNKIIYYSYWKD